MVTPLTVMPVPAATVLPVVKLLPVRVTATVVPRCATVDDVGAIEVNVAAGGLATVNGSALVVPMGVVTVMVRVAVREAVGVVVQFAVTLVAVVSAVTMAQVTPPPTVTAVAPVRLLPVSTTGTVVPRTPGVPAIDDNVGPCTVNGSVWVLVPDPVEMVVFLVAVSEAVAEMVHVAMAVSGSRTWMPLHVTPPPEIATAVAPVKLVPVSM